MMSRTVRVFKLMYIVAGILISNEEICDTVDRIQIAPRVEVKPEIDQSFKGKQQRALASTQLTISAKRPKRNRLSVTGIARSVMSRMAQPFSWLRKYDVRLIFQQWHPLTKGFNFWTIPNYLLECTSSYINKRFLINSDCDMIYK